MIPTRDEMETMLRCPAWTLGDQHLALSWMKSMRDEIDNLQKVYELTHDKWSIERRDSNKLRAAIIAIGTEVGAAVDESSTVDFLCEVEGEVKSVVGKLRADLDRANTEAALARDAMAKANQDHVMAKVTREANEAQIREQLDRIRAVTRKIIEVTGEPGPCSMEDAVGFIIAEVGRLRADLEIAMAKATTDTRAKVQNELRSVERALCSADVLIKYAEWPRGAYECHVKNTIETAIDALRDDSATTPYSPPFEGDPKDCAFKASDPVREAAIRAWEEEALFDMYEHADDDEKVHQDDAFLVRRREITAAVALMHSAGDGKALRELREWILEMWWVASQGKWETGAHTAGKVVGRIDEMLARPAPSHVYSRGRTIAESAEPPTAYYPPAPVEIWPEEMKRQTLVGKFEPAPVEKPAAAVPDDIGLGPVTDEMVQSGIAAVKDGRWITLEQLRKELAPVPDDTRELVAQLADLFKVHLSCNGGVNRLRSDRAAEIAARLRGSK